MTKLKIGPSLMNFLKTYLVKTTKSRMEKCLRTSQEYTLIAVDY